MATLYIRSAVLIGLLTVTAVDHPSAQWPVHAYRNLTYGFVVRLPVGVTILTNAPEAPDHGFGIRLADTTYIWTDASYNEDASTLDGTVAEVRGLLADTCRELSHKRTRLGGLRAIELSMQCVDRVSGNRVNRTDVIAYRHLIKYSISIERPLAAIRSLESERVFNALIRGFSFIPLKK